MSLDPKSNYTNIDIDGAGGGLIYFGVAAKLIMNGKISCNGMKGKQISDILYGGGGSGGSIKIMSKTFTGIGLIQARGGDSSENGLSGEGAGGIIDVTVLDADEIVDFDFG